MKNHIERSKKYPLAVLVVMLASASWSATRVEEPARTSAADLIVGSVTDARLRPLLGEVLDRNPRLARLRAEVSAIEQHAPQVAALPDPTASLTWFVMSPETRVGPQRAAINLMQEFPWFGTLEVDEQASLWDAVAARAKTWVPEPMSTTILSASGAPT